jgi:cell division protein FtsI (penicillin-binding protein 3)
MFGTRAHRNTIQSPVPAYKEAFGRILTVKIILVLLFAVIVVRLVQIQVLDSSRYREIARRQYEARVVLPATRGTIVDRNRKMLVSNTRSVSFGADPAMVGDKAGEVAGIFSREFGKPRVHYLEKLRTTGKRFVWLERHVRAEHAEKIPSDGYDGLIRLTEARRLYNYDHVAAHLIGFTDIDNKGLSGIELVLDRELRGRDGFMVMQRDGLGRKRPSPDYPRVEPVNGHHVVLTLDLEYQSIAEEELRRGIERTKADGGLVVMMDPANGEVLALAHAPGFDPHHPGQTDQTLFRNRAITDMFEPGSIFKVVTVSAALEHEVVTASQKFYAEKGTYTVQLPRGKSRIISDTHEYEMLTVQEAMELSSNIVMAKISDKIGAELLYTTARNFGFGIATGIGLPGEVSGELKKPTQWSGTTLNTMAYGYEVGVTPMQIAAAYCVVANGGVLVRPFVVKEILNQDHGVIERVYPQTVRRVLSKETAATMTKFFEGAVERGTGVGARVEGVAIAGKTGTSRKYVGGRYEAGSYTASFAGFFPAASPKVVCLVMLDNPRAGGYTGGEASAPIFRAIVQKVAAQSGRFTGQDVMASSTVERVVPDVTNMETNNAVRTLQAHGFVARPPAGEGVIISQSPPQGSRARRGSTVQLAIHPEATAVPEGSSRVPDLRGLAMRRAINRLLMQQLDVDVEGSGVVVGQYPSAGATVKSGTKVHLRCEPRNLASITLY